MRLLLTTVLATCAAVRIEHISAELDAPPPAVVRDIHGKEFPLPSATSAEGSAACVAAFAQVPRGQAGNRQNPFSTHAEDRAALGRFGGAPKAWGKGVFLEMGAFDGVTESNTIMLERCLGWRGVLVEASLRSWQSLKAAGRNHAEKVFAMPTCQNHTTAQMQSTSFTNAMAVDVAIAHGDPRATRVAVTVPCTSLTHILRRALGPRPRVDFFSLDVEGSELKVLETLNLKAVDVALIFAEARPVNEVEITKNNAVRALLTAAGYVLNPFHVTRSDVFLREDLMSVAAARRLLGAVRRARR